MDQRLGWLGPCSVIALAFAYAIVRYLVFGPTSASQLSLFISNKAISAAAVVCLLISAWHHRCPHHGHAAAWGKWTLHLAIIHVVLSLIILQPSYFEHFFDTETHRLTGLLELSLLFGALAAYGFWCLSQTSFKTSFPQRLLVLTTTAIALHLLFQGGSKWHPSRWYGGMPNISLLSLIVTLLALVCFLKTRKD